MTLLRWCCAVLLAAGLVAQSASRPSDPVVDDDELIDKITLACEALRTKGELKEIGKLRADPARECAVQLAPRRADRLDPQDVCALARKGLVIVGAYYQCKECDKWHFSSGSGFTITPDGVVATCWHVLEEDPDRGQSYLVAADLQGHAFAVRDVLAADPEADVCLLRTDLKDCTPLPLAAGVRQGTRIYCLSNPDERHASFGEGLVARWFVDRDTPAGAAKAESRPKGVPRLQVTVEFGQGSSGAPVLDACGNVVGLAQSTQAVLSTDDKDATGLQMVIRFAAPTEALLGLVKVPK